MYLWPHSPPRQGSTLNRCTVESRRRRLLSAELCLSWFQVMKKAHIARQKLLRLGIFKEVEVLIDTSEGNSALVLYHDSVFSWHDCAEIILIGPPSSGTDALPNGLDVTFEVIEVKRLTGSYNTMVGNNEGSMVRETLASLMSVTCPSVGLGRVSLSFLLVSISTCIHLTHTLVSESLSYHSHGTCFLCFHCMAQLSPTKFNTLLVPDTSGTSQFHCPMQLVPSQCRWKMLWQCNTSTHWQWRIFCPFDILVSAKNRGTSTPILQCFHSYHLVSIPNKVPGSRHYPQFLTM